MNKSILIVLLIGCTFCRFRPEMFEETQPNSIGNFTQKQYWFQQKTDHFDYANAQTWQQRYWVSDTFFNAQKGSVILYLCGEWVCSGITSGLGAVVQIAQQTNSLMVALEHRFYGQSMPFGNQSLQLGNLRWLNTEQALKDIANFIVSFSHNNLYKVTNNPWITVGGSYPGAVTAWFRYKYPHLTIGSISSSGVVNAIEDFTDFDESIYTSTQKSSNGCSVSIKQISDYVEKQLNGQDSAAFKADFGAQHLTNEQFLWYWSDVIVFQVQYGRRTDMCDRLKGKTIQEKYEVMRYQEAFKVDPREYSSYHLQDPSFYNHDGQVIRAWNFQVCSEFGWLQTFSSKHPMRSQKLTLEFFRDVCRDVYGIIPNITASNMEFGALTQKSTNLFMINADEDPWQWASIRKSQGNIISRTISCTNCAHCIDLKTPKEGQPKVLTKVRQERLVVVKKWISQYWRSLRPRRLPIKKPIASE